MTTIVYGLPMWLWTHIGVVIILLILAWLTTDLIHSEAR